MPKQRNAHRIPFETVAMVIHADHSHACDLSNLSLQGALLTTPKPLPLEIGDRCGLSVFLPSSELTLEFAVELMRSEGNAYGFNFIEADDVTLAHLRRLLELNLGDAELAEQEFRRGLSG